MDRIALRRKILLILGHNVTVVIGGMMQITRDDIGGKSQGIDLLQREIEQSDVICLKADFTAFFQKSEITAQRISMR